jgi:cell division protein ZapE
LTFAPDTDVEVAAVAAREGGAVEDWQTLVGDLSHVHPSRMGAYVSGVRELGLTSVGPLTDQNSALRFVTLVDRLYDRDVRIVASGAPLDQIFTPEMLRGGYRKKYFRALSRLAAMTAREG